MKNLFVLAFLCLASFVHAQPPDPLTCAHYPQQRIFLQSQAYWDQTPGKSGTDFGFVSEGTCFPVGATLTGKVHFDVIVMMAENPGTLTTVEIQLFGSRENAVLASAPSSAVNKKCATVCTMLFPLDVDTSKFKTDGLQEFRFHARITEPDKKQLMATTGWQAFLKNGYPVSNYRPQGVNFQEGRGWYTGEGYTTGRFASPMPWQPVSGTWKVSVAVVKGSGGRSVGAHTVALDACPTCTPEAAGAVLSSGSGELKTGTLLSVDTTKLANGLHTLSIKASAPAPSGSTLSGAMVIPFFVQN